jgi:hypothetical protein
MPFEKGHKLGFHADNQPSTYANSGRKKNPLTECLKKVLAEKVKVEVEKGKGKEEMTRMELMVRGIIQRATTKSDAAFLEIMNRVEGKVKDKLELSEKNPLGGAMGDLSRMTIEQQIAARPDLFRMLLEKADAMRVKVEDAEIVTEETPILSIASPKILE